MTTYTEKEIADAYAQMEAMMAEAPELTEEFFAAKKAAFDEYAATIVRTEEWSL